MPLAPEFAEFLLRTPADERTGFVFNPKAADQRTERLGIGQIMKLISRMGKKADVVVHVHVKKGKKKYATAHDFRRAFGDRWALRVMPAVLMEMMRHQSIGTTMQFYVGRSAQVTADVIWQAYMQATSASKAGNQKGDSSGDSRLKTAENGEMPKGGQ